MSQCARGEDDSHGARAQVQDSHGSNHDAGSDSARPATFREQLGSLCRLYFPDADHVLVQTFGTARKSDYILNGPPIAMGIPGRWVSITGISTIRYVTSSGRGLIEDQFDVFAGATAHLEMEASVMMSGPRFHLSFVAPIEGIYDEKDVALLERPLEAIREATAMMAATCGDDLVGAKFFRT
jgi:hypothetical protein